jgi:tubulin beta
MLKAKAYCHWYMQEGMDMDSFYEAQNNLQDLVTEYQQYEAA